MTLIVRREQVFRFRARVTHLDAKLSPGSFARAAWGGLQDSVPRAGIVSLHARVDATARDSWEDRSLVQIWLRGADYIVPRADVGIFTLGCMPRDPDQVARIERLADEVHRVTNGAVAKVRDVAMLLSAGTPSEARSVSKSGRVHIRWDASNIWLIPVARPEIDAEDARRELARRFLHWFGPTTIQRLAVWTGVGTRDAAETWKAIERDVKEVHLHGEQRFMLADDVETLIDAKPLSGVRLTPFDDPFTKFDHELLVRNNEERAKVLPRSGESPGYIPGALIVDGHIAGAWERQQRNITLHPFKTLSQGIRSAIEIEALAFPIEDTAPVKVKWEDDLVGTGAPRRPSSRNAATKA